MARKAKSHSGKELREKSKTLKTGQTHECHKVDKEGKDINWTVQGASHENSGYYKDLVAALRNKEKILSRNG